MAMFEPGHLHMERHALNKDDFSYNLCIDYKVDQDGKEGTGMSFRVHGTVEDKSLDETFFLAKDQAFDFARHATRVAQKGVWLAQDREHRLDAQVLRRNVRGRAQATGRQAGRPDETRTPGITA